MFFLLCRWGGKSILEKDTGFQAVLDALATATFQASALESLPTGVTSPTAAGGGSKSKRAKLNSNGQGATQAAVTQQLMLSVAHTADPSMQLVAPAVRLASSGKLVKSSLEQVRELHLQLSVAVSSRADEDCGMAEDISAAVSKRIALRLLSAA